MNVYRSSIEDAPDCSAPHLGCTPRDRFGWCRQLTNGILPSLPVPLERACDDRSARELARWRRGFKILAAASITITAGLAAFTGLLGYEQLRLIEALPSPPRLDAQTALDATPSRPPPPRMHMHHPPPPPPLPPQPSLSVRELIESARAVSLTHKKEVVFELHSVGASLIDALDRDSAPLFAHIVPVDVGWMKGTRLDIPDGSLFATIGLQNGDVLLNVDGIPITAPYIANQVFQRARDEKAVLIDVLRGDKQVLLAVEWD